VGERGLMGIQIEGIEGEQKLLKLLKDDGWEVFQPDTIGKKDGEWCLFECKHQARFLSPPFDGHGLPRWQVARRLQFEKETGIKCYLYIFDKETDEIFYQLLSVLEEGEYFDTHGEKPRRIYKLDSFKKI